MTDLCVRCAHLFKECRPLLGANCPMPKTAVPVSRPEDLPDVRAGSALAAAIAANARTGDFVIRPIRVTDFFRGRP